MSIVARLIESAAPLGVGHRGDVVVAFGSRRLVDGDVAKRGEIVLVERQIDVALADCAQPMPAHAGQAGHRGERHLPAHGEDQCLEQERETGQSARPGRLHQRDPAVLETNPGHPHFEQTVVLEEAKMPVELDLGVMHRMSAAVVAVSEAAAPLEVDADNELFLLLVEVHSGNEPRLRNAERSRKQVSMHRPSSSGSVPPRVCPTRPFLAAGQPPGGTVAAPPTPRPWPTSRLPRFQAPHPAG